MNSDFWKDIVAAIDHNYNTSAFKGMLITYAIIKSLSVVETEDHIRNHYFTISVG